MRTKSMLTAVTVSAASLAALGTLFTAPAQAGPRGGCDQDSQSPRVCLFENTNFNGGSSGPASSDHWRTFVGSDDDFRNNNWLNRSSNDSGDGMDNETSSLKTSIATCAVIYQHPSRTGASSLLLQNLSAEELYGTGIGDNRASSLDITC
ncbi:hypothetical protein [Streptomyces sp. B8F3]|uniref:hypothetical protein n=1 Tax=unclassified Streptomyces TaxID=2593676 RepID=UPI00325E6669